MDAWDVIGLLIATWAQLGLGNPAWGGRNRQRFAALFLLTLQCTFTRNITVSLLPAAAVTVSCGYFIYAAADVFWRWAQGFAHFNPAWYDAEAWGVDEARNQVGPWAEARGREGWERVMPRDGA